jgi:hypothetical protein
MVTDEEVVVRRKWQNEDSTIHFCDRPAVATKMSTNPRDQHDPDKIAAIEALIKKYQVRPPLFSVVFRAYGKIQKELKEELDAPFKANNESN